MHLNGPYTATPMGCVRCLGKGWSTKSLSRKFENGICVHCVAQKSSVHIVCLRCQHVTIIVLRFGVSNI